ncbi:hypothetical protein [Nonlabens sp.]|uniref:hypothetical protein n=1 Tax=Nonlabens sp. TaxID=1888209 RepID=UPI001BD1A3E8|nr:hypothetical protein [Nonlabens sp.]
MIKKALLTLVLLGFSNLHSQEVFIKTGKNSTEFNFSSPNNNPEISYRTGSGGFYEIGYLFNFENEKLTYSVGLTYNEWNASASYLDNSYTWETNYLGIQHIGSYQLYASTDLEVEVVAGVNTATIIRGDQFINTSYFDIKNSEEFSGIVVQPLLGASLKYFVFEEISLSLGYNFSKVYNLSNSTDEKLIINNSQFQFGLHIPI